jgi:hypothetical protein
MKKIILALALLGMLQTTVAQKKKKSSSKTTTITASEPVVRSSSSSSSSSTSSSRSSNSSSSAQEGFRQKDIFVSGSFGYTSSKDEGVSKSETSILPSLGYFLKDNIALLGTIGFKSRDNGGGSANTFVIGAAARYYITPAAKFSLFGQAGIGFESGDKTTVLTLGVSPGLNYFLNNHFSVEATVGEFGIVNTSGGGASNTDFNFGADLTKLGLGLNYKF